MLARVSCRIFYFFSGIEPVHWTEDEFSSCEAIVQVVVKDGARVSEDRPFGKRLIGPDPRLMRSA